MSFNSSALFDRGHERRVDPRLPARATRLEVLNDFR